MQQKHLLHHSVNLAATESWIKLTQNISVVSIRCWRKLPVRRLKGRAGNTSSITSVTVLCSPAEVVQHDVVVAAAEHPALHQAELLPGGQLPLAGETGETGQVVDAAPSPPHPVTGVHLPATLGALSAEPTVREKETGR